MAVKVAYFSETLDRVRTTINPMSVKSFPFVRVKMEGGGRTDEYAQIRGLFKAVTTGHEELILVFLVRWLVVLPEAEWDDTGQPLLCW